MGTWKQIEHIECGITLKMFSLTFTREFQNGCITYTLSGDVSNELYWNARTGGGPAESEAKIEDNEKRTLRNSTNNSDNKITVFYHSILSLNYRK